MTPTERIQLISELRRSFMDAQRHPGYKRLQEALADYEDLVIRSCQTKASVNSRALYMREHRRKERELIRKAKALITTERIALGPHPSRPKPDEMREYRERKK